MVKKSKGTGRNPLKMAKFLTNEVNESWSNGSFYEKVSSVTQDLLRFWFSDSFCDIRNINFHEGQKQAILNIIYLSEILKINNVKDLYLSTDPELLDNMDIDYLKKDKYQHPMFGVKMATGTGKTWVMNALLIWQYLNAKEGFDNFSKNFLIVAPGLIVYNRILDAFLGKENSNGLRDFETSDFMNFKELFIPEAYENKILGFLQSSVVKKDEISSKVTGDGLIAITNWHILKNEENTKNVDSPLDSPEIVLENVLPISPGKTAGNSLESLDNNYLRGKEIDYLASLDDLVVFNDEAHHIHEIKKGGEVFEVEWQKSLNKIAENKSSNFIQIDFSATPYNSSSGKNKKRHYFPHIIVDFDLKTAIHNGLVKMIAIDKRKEVSSIPLDYKAERDGKKVIDLSKGQKIMLRAGISKLNILSNGFKDYDNSKQPKMLVMCEDTSVAPFVTQFFIDEGLSQDEIMEIHSNRKGEVNEKEWNSLKQQLFNMDQHTNPKIIVSVLMLREGFDVNNICVIVPLRSSKAPILLEQTIGRGLRLMWREPEYIDIKNESRENILIKKIEPSNQLDLLSIIEHPKFTEFYDEFIEEGLMTEIKDEISTTKILGDMITVNLKDNYIDYDFYWPVIVKEQEENIIPMDFSLDSFKSYKVSLEELEKLKEESSDEKFVSQELTVRTKFGEYIVTDNLFNADSYNEFLFKIVKKIGSMIKSIKKGRRSFSKEFPMLQINNAYIAQLIDEYIRTKLFNCDFDPMINGNYQILLISKDIVSHILKQFADIIQDMQNNVDITDAIITKNYFSEVKELKMRENYSINVSKSIYEKLPYPSNKGLFEKLFMKSCDNDSHVNSFLKINEYYHTFAAITYIRDDGLLARYYPDFLVKINNDIYVVETKANKDLKSENVQSKRLATLDELEKINQLKGIDRMDAKWNYVLLSDDTFNTLHDKGASIKEILDYCIVTQSKAKGYFTLDDF
ncbi:MAG: DEAD/DEAH box helicase family protein [Methanobacteriaceae archaeon]|nr:DEAD/DEAH box helicase family protein [Methanobacteriaceae archaeon]